jgi:hypothetical protein
MCLKHATNHIQQRWQPLITQILKINSMNDKDENNSTSSNESENPTPYTDSNTYVERTENQDGIVKK